jgi:hypothetical protein
MNGAQEIGRSARWVTGCLAAAGMALAASGGPAAATPQPGVTVGGAGTGRVLAATAAPTAGRAVPVSRGCAGQNAEVEAATGPARHVYDLWIGCGGIGFARSTDGGRHFQRPVQVPGSAGFSWDPAIAVAPDGTVYAAYMHQAHGESYPVVAASFNGGKTFPQVAGVRPHVRDNWGDRDFIAVGPDGRVYLTWDYGPSAAAVKIKCAPHGSCYFLAGDVNAVVQVSSDGGKTWGPIRPLGPHFPRNGGFSAPVLVQPDGRVDVLSWGHHVGGAPGYTLHPGHEFFISSADGRHWSRPRELWPRVGSIALPTWWIDGDITADAGGNLYVTWDTQTSRGDIGWLSVSRDGGRTWGRPVRVTPGHNRALHIVEAVGGGRGIAYVGWQTNAPRAGYATYLRAYSTSRGWLGPAIRVSRGFGQRDIWPGDTFGIVALGPHRLVLSWGSAVGHSDNSQIWSAVVRIPATR